MSRSMYELTGDWLEALELLQDPEIPEEEVNALLDSIAEDITQKAQNTAFVIFQMKEEANAIEEQIKRLQARKKTTKNREESLKYRLYQAMKTTKTEQIKTPFVSVSISKNPVSVEVYDLDKALNSGFLKAPKMDESLLDKTAINDAINAGQEVPGCRLTQTEGIRIR